MGGVKEEEANEEEVDEDAMARISSFFPCKSLPFKLPSSSWRPWLQRHGKGEGTT